MPLTWGGQKTLWIYTGVFLFMCILVIMAPMDALPLVLCLPSLYSMLADKYSRPAYPAAVALAPALLAFVPGLAGSVVLYLCLIGCGMILNRLMAKGWISLAVLVPSCIVFALSVSGIAFLAHENGVTPQALIAGWVDSFMNQVMAMYEKSATQSILAEMREVREHMQGYVVKLFWGMSASSILSIMWLNLIIANSAVRRFNLRAWKCPDWMVGFFILAGVLSLLTYDTAQLVGLNLLFVVGQIYFFQGLAIVADVMVRYEWSKFIRWVIYILILTQIYIMIGVAGLGLFDTWFNFRKMIRKSEGDKT